MTAQKMRMLVYRCTIELGCPNKYIGSYYLRDGLCRMLEKPCEFKYLKGVYDSVTNIYNTSKNNVERSIRTLIDKWWELGQCGGLFTKKPTNSEMFHTLISHISLNLDLVC